MKDLPIRVATAIVLGALVIGGIYIAPWGLGLVLLCIGFFASSEYIKLAIFNAEISRPAQLTTVAALCTVLPLVVFLIISVTPSSDDFVISILFGLIAITLLLTYYLFKNEIGDWRIYQATSLTMVYIGLPLLLFQWSATHQGAYNWLKPMSLLLLIWCNDSMAYFCGRFFGKRPLYKDISPKKTIEGFLGGLILTIVGGLMLSVYIQHLTPVQWVVYSFLVSIVSTVGDLFESMIKRRFGVKDSGTILPGHGGFLDRFDAFIFVIPIATLFLYLYWK